MGILNYSTAIPTEKNVPPPPPPKGAEEIVPELAQMGISDSLFIPNAPGSGNPPVSAVKVSLYGVRTGKVFRQQYEDFGLRVWRER